MRADTSDRPPAFVGFLFDIVIGCISVEESAPRRIRAYALENPSDYGRFRGMPPLIRKGARPADAGGGLL